MARSSSDSVTIHYVLLLLWMTSRLAVVDRMPKCGGCTLQWLPWAAWLYQGGVWCLMSVNALLCFFALVEIGMNTLHRSYKIYNLSVSADYLVILWKDIKRHTLKSVIRLMQNVLSDKSVCPKAAFVAAFIWKLLKLPSLMLQQKMS